MKTRFINRFAPPAVLKRFAPQAGSKFDRIIVASVALLLYSGLISGIIPDSSREAEKAELAAKVRELNAALQVHEIFGGTIEVVMNPIEALEQLHSAGRGGRYIDVRLSGTMQNTDEANSGEPRAVWNYCKGRFEVTYGLIQGIKRFYYDETRSDPARLAEMDRRAALEEEDQSEWMWNPRERQIPLFARVDSGAGIPAAH